MVDSGSGMSEKDMQAEHDASILAAADEILKDKARLNAAYGKIDKMASDAQDRAAAMSTLAAKVKRQAAAPDKGNS